ncbi:hypothetical protein [Candidatus Vidania fulgoroideorum]
MLGPFIIITLMKKAYLLGNPTIHSISPLVHTRIAIKYHRRTSYSLLNASIHYIYLALHESFLNGYAGSNITIPHKIIAYKIHDYSARFGSFNVIKICANAIICFNSDVRSCILLKSNLLGRARRALLIGYGGVSKSIHHILPSFPIYFRRIDTRYIINIMLYNLILDCSSSILNKRSPCNFFTNGLYTVSYTHLFCYLFYYRIISGLKMLLIQATLSFYIF